MFGNRVRPHIVLTGERFPQNVTKQCICKPNMQGIMQRAERHQLVTRASLAAPESVRQCRRCTSSRRSKPIPTHTMSSFNSSVLGLAQPLRTKGVIDENNVYVNNFSRAARPLESDVLIKNGILSELKEYGREIIPARCHDASNYLVTDSICDELYAEKVVLGFRAAGLNVRKLVVPVMTDKSGETSTEPSKTREVFDQLVDEIIGSGINKNSCIISLGGGVVNNICGVLAANLYRGITLVHLTTTTMGAFDAAIDFKQGINHPLGKNLLGTYWPASTIVIDPTTFRTLSQRHLLNGIAEALKHGFCQSRELTDLIVKPLAQHGAGKL
eukprot:6180801-Pleurochrysis_carterae.AAC.2